MILDSLVQSLCHQVDIAILLVQSESSFLLQACCHRRSVIEAEVDDTNFSCLRSQDLPGVCVLLYKNTQFLFTIFHATKSVCQKKLARFLQPSKFLLLYDATGAFGVLLSLVRTSKFEVQTSLHTFFTRLLL